MEIKKTENDQYFIEIMYNYAKIEVIVDENALSESIAYAMTSAEGENVPVREIRLRGAVESWLAQFEEQAQRSLRNHMKTGLKSYFEAENREDWISMQPGQRQSTA